MDHLHTQDKCEQPADLAHLFASRGLRCTRQRRAIYQALAATKAHPTADDLYHDVSPRVRGLSLATVYNTLEAFCSVGLAQKIGCPSGPARYDATTHEHLHLRCKQTGEVFDVPEDLSDRLLRELSPDTLADLQHKLGFSVSQVRVELVGEFE